MENLKNMGFPVDGLAFDPDLVICFLWQAEGIWKSNPYYLLFVGVIFAFYF
jgi:hypothetical protein